MSLSKLLSMGDFLVTVMDVFERFVSDGLEVRLNIILPDLLIYHWRLEMIRGITPLYNIKVYIPPQTCADWNASFVNP